MEMAYIFAGMFVHIIVLFDRNFLKRQNVLPICYVIASAMFVIGLIFLIMKGDGYAGFLITPLISLILYQLMFNLFVKMFKKEPVDTYHTLDMSLGNSMVFNIIFWTLGFFIPAAIIMLLT